MWPLCNVHQAQDAIIGYNTFTHLLSDEKSSREKNTNIVRAAIFAEEIELYIIMRYA